MAMPIVQFIYPLFRHIPCHNQPRPLQCLSSLTASQDLCLMHGGSALQTCDSLFEIQHFATAFLRPVQI